MGDELQLPLPGLKNIRTNVRFSLDLTSIMWYNANQYNTKVIMVMIRGNVMNKGYDLSAYDRNQHSVYL